MQNTKLIFSPKGIGGGGQIQGDFVMTKLEIQIKKQSANTMWDMKYIERYKTCSRRVKLSQSNLAVLIPK